VTKKFYVRNLFCKNSWNVIYTKSTWLQLQSWKEPQLMFLGGFALKISTFWVIFLEWWWWRNYQKFDGPSLHPIKLKNVMAIKAFCEKLMAITHGPSLMDHHRHVWSRLYLDTETCLILSTTPLYFILTTSYPTYYIFKDLVYWFQRTHLKNAITLHKMGRRRRRRRQTGILKVSLFFDGDNSTAKVTYQVQ